MSERNDRSKARVGILSYNENNCESCNSRIEFGTGKSSDDSNSCRNAAAARGDNGDANIKAVVYIFVQ